MIEFNARTLSEWLCDVTGANPDLLGPFYPGNVGLPNERRPDRKSPADPTAPSATPQDLQKMGRSNEQAELFHCLLRANAERPAGEGYEELLELAKTVGWLHTKQCLPALRSILETVVKRDVQKRPELLKALADQVGTFPPQDEDYLEPTDDQVSALEALLKTASDDLKPEQWSDVLPTHTASNAGAAGDGTGFGHAALIARASSFRLRRDSVIPRRAGVVVLSRTGTLARKNQDHRSRYEGISG